MKNTTEQLLRRSRMFAGLDGEQLAQVGSLGKELQIAQGEAIVHEAEEGSAIFLLVQGRVNVEMRHPFSGGKPQVLATIEPGETFSELSLVDRKARSATCRAIEPVVVLGFENEELEALMARSPEIGYRLMRNTAVLLASRLRDLNVKMQRAMVDIFYY